MNIPQLKKFTIIYNFNHRGNLGFSNEITVMALNEVQAMEKAKIEVSGCYVSGMLKNFQFKIKH